MLIKCPECQLQVSDKANTCPHCGYPLRVVSSSKRYQPKRMRLPNGFGQISEIKGRNLRNPFRVMVNVGFTETGKPISKILKPQGYFKTYNEAYQALLEYHRDPRAFGDDTTINDLYEKWLASIDDSRKTSSFISAMKFGLKHAKPIAYTPIQELRQKHIKQCLDQCSNLSSTSIVKVKNFLNQILDYCVERELIEHNPAREYKPKTKKTLQNHHIPFADWEMEILWGHQGENIFVDMILIDCYSGWRPGELVALRTSDISDSVMVGGMKTEYGKDRTVPIHPKISHLVAKYRLLGHEKLFDMNYQLYHQRFYSIIGEYGLNTTHKPHDCRVQFVTELKKAGVDEYLIKRLVGHSIKDLTEAIYTHRDISQLREAVEKIK